MNLSDTLKVIVIVVLLINILGGWLLLRAARGGRLISEMRGLCNTLSSQMGELTAIDSGLDKRVSVLETHIKLVPSHLDLANIRGELRDMNTTQSRLDANVAGLNEKTDAIGDSVKMIHQHLLDQEKK